MSVAPYHAQHDTAETVPSSCNESGDDLAGAMNPSFSTAQASPCEQAASMTVTNVDESLNGPASQDKQSSRQKRVSSDPFSMKKYSFKRTAVPLQKVCEWEVMEEELDPKATRHQSSGEASSSSSQVQPQPAPSLVATADIETEWVTSEPKRPQSAFFLFASKAKEKTRGSVSKDTVLEMQESWKTLDPLSKSHYVRQAQQLQSQYEAQRSEYAQGGRYRVNSCITGSTAQDPATIAADTFTATQVPLKEATPDDHIVTVTLHGAIDYDFVGDYLLSFGEVDLDEQLGELHGKDVSTWRFTSAECAAAAIKKLVHYAPNDRGMMVRLELK